MKKIVFTTLIAFAASGSLQARPEVTMFLKTLNDCLANPASFVTDCAHKASLRTGLPTPSVFGELDLVSGESTGTNNGKVGVCSGGSYDFCDWYDCKEDHENQMSICTFTGSTCTFNGRACSQGPE